MLAAETLREWLDYDPATGVFRWKKSNRGLAGEVAGSSNGAGHLRIMVLGKRYCAHRLAWLHVHGEWPDGEIDHADNVWDNNRIANLRPATRSQNAGNQKRHTEHSTGFKGVHRVQRGFQARLCGEHVGFAQTAEEAHAKYMAAAKKMFGEFARGE